MPRLQGTREERGADKLTNKTGEGGEEGGLVGVCLQLLLPRSTHPRSAPLLPHSYTPSPPLPPSSPSPPSIHVPLPMHSYPPAPPPPPSKPQHWSNCCSVVVLLCVMLTTFVYFAIQCVDGVLKEMAGTHEDPREYLGVTATVQQGASVVLIVALLHAVIVLVAITCLWRRLVGVTGKGVAGMSFPGSSSKKKKKRKKKRAKNTAANPAKLVAKAFTWVLYIKGKDSPWYYRCVYVRVPVSLCLCVSVSLCLCLCVYVSVCVSVCATGE